MKRLFFFLAVLFTSINLNLHAQLSGIKNIPGNYATVQLAIAALNTQGVGSGGVTFNVAAGHTETSANMTINITSNLPTAANQILFQKSGSGANPLITAVAGTSASTDAFFKFNGADYVTFDRIDLFDPSSNTGNAQMEFGFVLLRKSATNGSQNNVIKNCTVTLQKINTLSIGIYLANRDLNLSVVTATNSSGLNSGNKFYGNIISNVYSGISLMSVATNKDSLNEVGVNGQASNNISNFEGVITDSYGIRCEGQSNLKIINNVINGGNGTTGNATVYGIYTNLFGSLPGISNYEISYNNVSISTFISATNYGIRARAQGDTIRIHHNTVENCNTGQVNNGFIALSLEPSATVNAAYLYNNIIRNNIHAGTGTTTLIGISGNGFINNLSIHANQIYGNQKTSSSGTFSCISTKDGNISCDSNQIYNNSYPNISGSTAVGFYGYLNDLNNPSTEKVFNNNIYNLSMNGGGGNNSTTTTGIRINSDTTSTVLKEIYGNTIHGFSGFSGQLAAGGVIGIWSSNGSSTKIYKNKVFDLFNTIGDGCAGIIVSSGTTIQISDNLISDLKCPFASLSIDAIRGICSRSITPNSTIGIYNNYIYLTAVGDISSNSSAAGIWLTADATATTASVEMKHNTVINLASYGSILTVNSAYRRSSTSLANFAVTSDSNNFYTGTPSGRRVIYYDGTNKDQTITSYKTRVNPRETHTVSVLERTLNLEINFQAYVPIDTITAEIRSAVSPYNLIDDCKGLGGQGIKQVLTFTNVVDSTPYYIVVKHRNSIETWSKSGGEMFSNTIMTYDFTSASSQAFGNNLILSGGKWSQYGGDENQDGFVDVTDLINVYNDVLTGNSGYIPTDMNGDYFADVDDLIITYNNLINLVGAVLP